MAAFMDTVKALLASKKFLTTMTGFIMVLLGKAKLDIDDETVWQLVILISACVTGQGIADFGKYKSTQ